MSLERYRHLELISILLIGVLISSCQSPKISYTRSPLVFESPIYEVRGLLTPIVPTPHPGCGVVVGYLVSETPANLVGLSVFLGDIITLGDGSYGAFLNRQTAPVANLDFSTGWFVFKCVSPGLYALIVSEPELGSWVYMQADKVKVVEVREGQVIDLGEVPLNW